MKAWNFEVNEEFLVYVIPIGSIPDEYFFKYLNLLKSYETIQLVDLTPPGGRKTSPFEHFSWSNNEGIIRYNFVPFNERMNEEPSLQPHQVVIGLLGICYFPTFAADLNSCFTQFQASCTEMQHIVVKRCFVFEYDFKQGLPTVDSSLGMFPEELEIDSTSGEMSKTSTIQLHMEVELHTITVALIQALETAVSDPETSVLMKIGSDPMNEDTKWTKHQTAREGKLAGDFSLMVSSPQDAIKWYKESIEQIKTSSAHVLWYATALEGMAAAFYAQDPNVCLPQIIKYSFEAFQVYAKCRAIDQQMNLAIKLAWCFTLAPRKRECLDTLAMAESLACDLSLTQRSKLCSQAALMCKAMKLHRKSVLYIHEMALIQAQQKDWNFAHALESTALSHSKSEWMTLRVVLLEQLMLTAKQLGNITLAATYSVELLQLCAKLEPYLVRSAAAGEDNQHEYRPGLHNLQKGFMAERKRRRSSVSMPSSVASLCSSSTNNTTPPSLTRAVSEEKKISRLLQTPRISTPRFYKQQSDIFDESAETIGRQRRSSVIAMFSNSEHRGKLERLVASQQTLVDELEKCSTFLPPNFTVSMENLPSVEKMSIRPSPVELRVHSRAENPKGVVSDQKEFLYNPFEKAHDKISEKKDPWLQDQVAIVDAWVTNPLSVPLVLQNVHVIVEGVEAECYSTSVTLSPHLKRKQLTLAVKPLAIGEVRVKGLSIRALNLVSEHIISDLQTIQVLPRHPVLSIRDHFPRASSMNLFTGERRDIQITLENTGPIPIGMIDIKVSSDLISWDQTKFRRHLPFQPRDTIVLPFTIVSASPSCQKAEITIQYARDQDNDGFYRELSIPIHMKVESMLRIEHCVARSTFAAAVSTAVFRALSLPCSKTVTCDRCTYIVLIELYNADPRHSFQVECSSTVIQLPSNTIGRLILQPNELGKEIELNWKSSLGSIGKLCVLNPIQSDQQVEFFELKFQGFQQGKSPTKLKIAAGWSFPKTFTLYHPREWLESVRDVFYDIPIKGRVFQNLRAQSCVFIYQDNRDGTISTNLSDQLIISGPIRKTIETNSTFRHDLRVCFLQPGLYHVAFCLESSTTRIFGSTPVTIKVL